MATPSVWTVNSLVAILHSTHVMNLSIVHLKEDAPGYNLLHRVFHDQYVVEKGKVELRYKHKVSSDSLQSPDDPDAAYRNKDGQKVSGYVTNITETVEEDKPGIITSVQTEPVDFADCHFLEDAVFTFRLLYTVFTKRGDIFRFYCYFCHIRTILYVRVLQR